MYLDMIVQRKQLACGCDRIDTHETDVVEVTDERYHLGFEKNMLDYTSGKLFSTTPVAVARALTWFHRHDDPRGVDRVRALPHPERMQLLRGLRDLEPDERIDPAAVAAMFAALGLKR